MNNRTKQPYSEKLRKQRERQQRERDDRERMQSYVDMNDHLDSLPIILVHDPIDVEEGGFRPGAKLDPLEIDTMIEMGILADGTILENRKNGIRKIVKTAQRRKNVPAHKILVRVNA